MKNSPVNIFTNDSTIHLQNGRHHVYLVGGWGITLGEFSLSLRDTQAGQEVQARETWLRAQTYVRGRKAKRVFVIDVPITQRYEVIYHKVDTLTVTPPNLFTASLLSKNEPVRRLEVTFVKTRSGFWDWIR